MATKPKIVGGLSRPQRTWLRRLYNEGYFGLGNATLESLKRAGLADWAPARDAVLSRRWFLTAAGRQHFEGRQ